MKNPPFWLTTLMASEFRFLISTVLIIAIKIQLNCAMYQRGSELHPYLTISGMREILVMDPFYGNQR